MVRKAFVVDDDDGVCESLVELLQMSGIEAYAFSSGRAFIGLLPKKRDLLLRFWISRCRK